ncbi:MAG: hypothetical protein KDA28_01405, partial [Phycisphaerales bacterium]|nr:hypothetical protein [Phycisphaerales bacterium]
MKLGQHMKLAPRMIQSMEILQMPLAELQERIEQELESNIALELGTPDSTDAPAEARSDTPSDTDSPSDRELDAGDTADDFARLDDYEADHPDATENEYSSSRANTEPIYDPSYSPASRYDPDNDPKGEAMANAPARPASLHDQLFDQWSLIEIDESLRPLGRLLIEKLDSDGYLRTPLDDIARDAPQSLQPINTAELEQALTAVQLFLEPVGIASRDARECLLLQLDALEEDADAWSPADDRTALIETARAIVEDHLDDLMNNRLPRIAERTGRSLDDIKAALQILRRLSLAPARRLIHDAPEPIIPDAIVEYDPDADRYFAYLNESRIPNLLVN